MTNQDKLLRDIETLRESIALNKAEMAKPELTSAERVAIIKHSALCMKELADLVEIVNRQLEPGVNIVIEAP